MADEERRLRFLRNWYAAYGAAGQDGQTVDSVSGRLLTFNTKYALPLVSLKLNIEGLQDLHGYDYPWPDGGGKNLLRPWHTNTTNNGITYTVNSDGTFRTSGIATANSQIISSAFTLPAGDYRLSGLPVQGSGTTIFLRALLYESNGSTLVRVLGNDYGNGGTFNIAAEDVSQNRVIKCFTAIQNGQTAPTGVWKPMISRDLSSTDPFEPYSNICLITAFGGASIYHSGDDTSDYTRYDVTFGTPWSVYSGELNVLTGALTVTKVRITLSSSMNWASHGSVGSGLRYTVTLDPLGPTSYLDADLICSHARYLTGDNGDFGTYNLYNNVFMMKDNNGIQGSLSNFKNYLSAQASSNTPVTIAYNLAVPQHFLLTPIQIDTLIGTNNIWSNAGTLEAEYIR